VNLEHEPTKRLWTRELPEEWTARAAILEGPGGDHGMTALRARAAAAVRSRAEGEAATLESFGATVLGPVYTVFCDWVLERSRRAGIGRVLCLMREGHLLSQMLGEMTAGKAGAPRIGVLWASRLLLRRASLRRCDVAELREFLGRPRPLNVGEAIAELGIEREDLEIFEPYRREPVLGSQAGRGLLEYVAASAHLREQIREVAARRRERYLRHLDQVLEGDYETPTAVVDLGYAGTVQRLLVGLLADVGRELPLSGFYLMTEQAAAAVQRLGSECEGYLSAHGEPRGFFEAAARGRQVQEEACMPPVGPCEDITEDGAPVNAVDVRPARQLQATERVQAGILAFTRLWVKNTTTAARRAATGDPGLKELLRRVLVRAAVDPFAEEIEAFRDWVAEDNFSPGLSVPLAPRRALWPDFDYLTVDQLTKVDPHLLYWLAACGKIKHPRLGDAIGHALAGTVAPDVFNRAGADLTVEAFACGAEHTEQLGRYTTTVAVNSSGAALIRVPADNTSGRIRQILIRIELPPSMVRLDGIRLVAERGGGSRQTPTASLEPGTGLQIEGAEKVYDRFYVAKSPSFYIRAQVPDGRSLQCPFSLRIYLAVLDLATRVL
jgi:hypothetical protein